VANAPTANEIKTQLVALFTPVIGTSGTKKAKILDYLPEAFVVPEYEDITALRSPLDTTTLASGGTDKRVNCLLITELGFSQAPPQSDDTRAIRQPRGRNLITRRFGLYYLSQFGDVNGSRSEGIFSTNVELVRTTLNNNPKLGFAVMIAGERGQGELIDSHNGLQVSSMLPASFAGVICHLMEGSLEVKVIEGLGVSA
jgi:hypothetical protein